MRKITESDLAGKGNLGRPDIPGVSTTEMQRILDELSREVIVPAFNELSGQVETAVNDRYTKEEADRKLNDKAFEVGAGDMTKAVYDPNNNGVNVTVQPWSCAKAGTVYTMTGVGSVGRCKIPATWASGDTFSVNGNVVPAYCGADAVDGDTIVAGRWVLFTYDGTQLNFSGGGGLGLSKLAQATAAADNVLAGKSFYAANKTLKEGSMPNRGAWGAQLSPGGGTNVPGGYHTGGGQVTVQKAKVSAFAQLSGYYGGGNMDKSYTVTDVNALVIIMYGSNLNKINEPIASSGTVSSLGTLGCQSGTDGNPYMNYAKGYMVNNIDGSCTLRLTTSSWDWGFGFIILKVN